MSELPRIAPSPPPTTRPVQPSAGQSDDRRRPPGHRRRRRRSDDEDEADAPDAEDVSRGPSSTDPDDERPGRIDLVV